MLSEILDFLQYLYAVFCLCSVRSALTLISGVYHDHTQQPDADAFCASFCSAYKTLISSELISPARSTDRKQMSLISCVCPQQRAGTMHTQQYNTRSPLSRKHIRTREQQRPQINKPGLIHAERNKHENPEVNNKHNKYRNPVHMSSDLLSLSCFKTVWSRCFWFRVQASFVQPN